MKSNGIEKIDKILEGLHTRGSHSNNKSYCNKQGDLNEKV